MRLQDTTYARDPRSLVEVTTALAADGWDEQATPLDGGVVRCEACTAETAAGEITVDSLCRLEGASDPDDMAAVVGLTCPSCSAKVVLVLSYGPGASPEDADVLLALPDAPQ